MAYLYTANLDVFDRRDQLEIMLDNGDSAILRRGSYYDLTSGELARARRYVVMTFVATAPNEEPIGVVYLPVKGNPTEGQVPTFSLADGAFVPGAGGGGGSGGNNVLSAILAPDGHYYEVIVDNDGRVETVDVGTTAPPGGPAPYATLAGLQSVESKVGHLHPAGYAGSLSATITAAGILGKTVVVDTTYTLTAGLVLPDNVKLELRPGGVMDFTGLATGGTCVDIAGSEGSTVALTANAVEGATTLTCAAGGEAGIATNDWLRVASDTIYDPNRTASPIGEMVQVLSTASGTITLRSPIRDTYNTANSAVFSKVTMRVGAGVTGEGTIICGNQHTGVRLDRSLNCNVEGVRFNGTASSCAVYFRDSVGGRAINCHAVGFNYASNGYGVDFDNACQNCRAIGCTFRDVRHATTTGNSASRKGIVRDCWVESCDAWDTTGDCFDTHAATDGMHFRDCHSYDSVLSGFNLECSRATVEGCEAWRSGAYGIIYNNYTVRPTDVHITDNKVYNSVQQGIRVTNANLLGDGSVHRQISVTDNFVRATTSRAIYIVSTDSWRFSGVKCNDNTIDAPVSYGIQIVKADDVTVQGNVLGGLAGSQYGIYISDFARATVGGNTVRHNSATSSNGIYIENGEGASVAGNTCNGAGTGIRFANTVTDSHIGVNETRGCTTFVVLGTGAMNTFGGQAESVQTVTTDATFTLTPWTSARQTFHTGTLTANRTVPLSTTQAVPGMKFRISRTGAGAFDLQVGTGPLVALGVNEWCEVEVDQAGVWKLAAVAPIVIAASQPINVMDSLVPYVDVQRDGVTNDTAAIQSRLDLGETSGRAVYFPGGADEYMAVGLTVGSNTRVFGDFGTSVIKMPDSAVATGGLRYIFTNKLAATAGNTNIRITGLTFDGNVAGSNAATEFYFGIALYGVRNFGIDWCTFRNLRGDGIYINKSTTAVESSDFHIDHIFLDNVGVDAGTGNPRQGIAVVQGKRFTIRNVVANKVGGPAGTAYIVDLEPNSSADAIEDFTVDGIHGYDCQGGIAILQFSGGSTQRGFVNNVSLKDGPTNTIQDVVHITLADAVHVGAAIASDVLPATGLLLWLSDPSPPTNFTCDANKMETLAARSATTTIQANSRLVIQNGTGPISSVVATWAGHVVTFKAVAAVTFTDGSNLKLVGNFTDASEKTLSMICDGTNWYETDRSVTA